jgi:hypothetical protein
MSKTAKAGREQVAVTRNGFDTIATEIVSKHGENEQGSKAMLALVLEAAKKTSNKPEAIEAFRVALIEAYAAKKCAKATASVYASEAKRICTAYYLTATIQIDGTKKAKRVTGAELFADCGYNVAKKRASALIAANKSPTDVSKKRGRKSKADKPLDRAGIIDALDQVIAAVRVTAGFKSEVLEQLLATRSAMQGAKATKPEAAKRATKVYASDVLQGKAKRDQLSRGQKAALSRAMNASKRNAVAARNAVMH